MPAGSSAAAAGLWGCARLSCPCSCVVLVFLTFSCWLCFHTCFLGDLYKSRYFINSSIHVSARNAVKAVFPRGSEKVLRHQLFPSQRARPPHVHTLCSPRD